jgi:hypothetical protein
MRKVLWLIGLIIVFFNGSAQYVKEHAFNDQASVKIHMVRLENSGQKICVVNIPDSITYQYVFYNPDYTEFKTISIDLEPLFIASDYNSPSLDVSYIAENVFDQDPDIDLLGQLIYFDAGGAEYAQVIVFNQDGSTLFKSDVDNSNAWLINSSVANSSLISSLSNTDEGAKMILDVDYFNEGLLSYDVYDLPGTLPSAIMDRGLTDESSGNYLRAYPVPANEFVDMNYQLAGDQNTGMIEIIDEQGKTVQRIRVNANRGTIRVPVTHFQNGPYIYKINTRRGVPRSGKMIVN